MLNPKSHYHTNTLVKFARRAICIFSILLFLIGTMVVFSNALSSPVFAQFAAPATSTATTTEETADPEDTTIPELTPEEIISSFVPTTEIDTTIIPPELLEFGVTLDLTPELPGPFTDVAVLLISYNVDLNRSDIIWEVDGKTMLSGKGETRHTIRTGAIGSPTNLSVTVAAPDGRVTTKELRIIPAAVDLVWQSPDSYVPPFYKGKALYSHQGSLQVIAVPTLIRPGGTRINPKNLIYKWYRGSTVINDQSGYGKNSVIINETTPADALEVSVQVSTEDGSITATKKITISSRGPEVVLYENRPLEGVRYDQALSEESLLRNDEMEIRAVPYYFSGGASSSNLNYRWYVNGALSQGQIQPSVVVRSTEKNGAAQVKAAVISKDKVFQRDDFQTLIRMGR